MSFPAPTRRAHQRFCDIEGWAEVRNSNNDRGHHLTYELELGSGEILRTRVSHPPDNSNYGHALWSHILRDQLTVTEDEFWACVQHGEVPARTADATPAVNAMPTQVIWHLVNDVGIPETDVMRMSKDEAIDRLNEFWTYRQ